MFSSLNNTQSGSALIAVSALLLLLGVFMGLGINSFQTKSAQDKYNSSTKKLETLSYQLSAFVQLNNRLPCPANSTVGYNNANYGVENCTLTRGDVPIRTLRIPDSYMLDAWGNRIRYAVSPFAVLTIFSWDTEYGAHAYCRSNDNWVVGIPGSCATKYNLNINKAQFCCPSNTTRTATATDIRIRRKDGSFVGRNRTTSDIANPNTGVTVASLPAPTNPHQIEAPAYILISHGANGAGGVIAGSDEEENTDADLDFIDRYRDLANETTTFFDDIVLYRTQFQTMAELNSGSCTRPYSSVTPDQPCP